MADTGFKNPTTASSSTWSNPNNVKLSDNTYTTSTTATDQLLTSAYGFSLIAAGGEFAVIDKIEVQGEAHLSGVGGSQRCTLGVKLSWDGGTTFTSVEKTANYTSGTDTIVAFTSLTGEDENQFTFGRKWKPSELSNSNFRARFEVKTISALTTVNLDNVQVKVTFTLVRHVGAAGSINFADNTIILMG